jgi:outer membrane protein, heavy metal efflux system
MISPTLSVSRQTGFAIFGRHPVLNFLMHIAMVMPFAVNILVRTLMLLLAAVLPASAGASELEQLIDRALQASQELVAGEERVAMARAKAEQAGSLEDPMLMLGIQNGLLRDPLAFDREAETSKVIGVSQMLPFYGKRDLRRRGAEVEAAALAERLLEKRLVIRRMVKETWYRLGLVDTNLGIIAKTIHALRDLLNFSETMYSVGKGLQQDVLKAQLELSKMEEMRIELQGERQMLVASLNGLTYRDGATPVATVVLPAIDAPPAEAEELMALALSRRPLFKAQAALLEKSLVGRELAEREIYPDVTVAAEYMQRESGEMSEGDDMYGLSFTFNLPVQHGRRQAMIAEAGAEHRMLLAEFAMLRNDLRKDLGETLAKLSRIRGQVELYRHGLLDQAAALHETTIASYQAGKADFMAVLDSRMGLFTLERRLQQALADSHVETAALEVLVGGETPGAGPR